METHQDTFKYFKYNCTKMTKNTIISTLHKFETTHSAGMFASNNTHAAGVGPVLHNLQQKDGFNVFSKYVDAIPVR